VLGRVLREALGVAPFHLVSLQGGRSWNAIPRDAVAVCSVPPDNETRFREAVTASDRAVRDAYKTTDPGVGTGVSAAAAPEDAWTDEGTRTLLDLLAVVPSGPLAMSPDFEGLVETSTSVGEVRSDGNRFDLHSLTRTSNASALPDVIGALDAVARLAGGRLELGQSDPG
jgi:dipeptidase D